METMKTSFWEYKVQALRVQCGHVYHTFEYETETGVFRQDIVSDVKVWKGIAWVSVCVFTVF